MHMDLQDIRHRRHNQGAAERVHRLPHLIGGRQLLPADQHLGAEVEVALGGHVGQRGRRIIDFTRLKGLGREDGIPLDEADHPLEHADEAHPSRVDDAGLLQHRHELGGVGECHLAVPEHLQHEVADVVGGGRGAFRRVGGLAGHRQDRALARLIERLLQLVGAAPDRGGDLDDRGGALVRHRLGESHEEVREHHPRIAPGSQHGGACHGPGRVRERGVAERAKGIGDGAQGEAEVRAGIAVGNGKYVDAVDLLAPRSHPVGGCEERAGQAGPVNVGDAGGHRPIPGRC